MCIAQHEVTNDCKSTVPFKFLQLKYILTPTWNQISVLVLTKTEIWFHVGVNSVHLFDNYASFTNEIFGQLLSNCSRYAINLNTTVSDWAWTSVIRTRMFLVRNERVAMRKLPLSKDKLCSLVNGHTAIYGLKSLPLETWQYPHSNAYVSHEKHTRSSHACPSSIRNRSMKAVSFFYSPCTMCIKKLNLLKFELLASSCITLTALNTWN